MLNAALVEPAAGHSPNAGEKTNLGRFGDYELLEEIAHGGMGVVYRARQTTLNRIVAVKMLLLGRFSSDQSIQRFHREATAAASLQHPNIVAIHNVGEIGGQHFFSMDFVDGRSLASLVRESPLPAEAAARYCQSIAEAIAYAHCRGIIHRDLKPSNVLIDAFDQVHITDFGLAKPLDGTSDLTLTGHLLGSPNYLPPELLDGKQRGADVRNDVYSIGAILYECLTGRPPFLAESIQGTLLKIRDTQVLAPRLLQPQVPRDLETICLKCLEKDPQKRYSDGQELSRDLGRFLKGEPIHARPVSLLGKARRWCRRKPALAGLTAATVLLMLSIIIGSPIAVYRINTALQRAEDGELKARQRQYAADMNAAHQAIAAGDFFRSLQLLNRNRPANNSDLRGWEWRYLWQQCQGQQQVILGDRSNSVYAVGFLPDGKTIYSAGKDKAVHFWDLPSQKQIDFLTNDLPVTGCAASPDGRWMVTSAETQPSDKGPLRLWDLQNKPANTVLATNFWVRPNTMLFSPDSKLLAFVDSYEGVRLWDVVARREITNMPAYHHFNGALGIAFSADGRTLAYSENEEGDIALWDGPGRSHKFTLKGHRLYVHSLAFTPDGRALVSASMDKTAKLWNLADGPGRGTFSNLSLDAEHLRLSPGGTVLATTSKAHAQRMILQEIPSGVLIRELIGHASGIADAAFSPDGETIVTGSYDGSLRVWPVRLTSKREESRPYSGAVEKLAYGTGTALCPSPDGRQLLVVYADGTFSLWDTVALSEGARQTLSIVGFQCAALAPGGKTAAFIGKGGKVVLWHADGSSREEFSLPTKDGASRACFSADGRRLAIGGWHDICIFDIPSKTPLSQFHIRDKGTVPEDNVMSLAFSSDGQKLLVGFYYGKVMAWNFTRPGRPITMQASDLQICGVAMLADGETLVSAGRQVSFWNSTSGREIVSFRPRPTNFKTCAISPDGRRLAVGALDGLITIWDLESRQELATLNGHDRWVYALSFLDDQNTMVSIGLDHVRLWRAPPLSDLR